MLKRSTLNVQLKAFHLTARMNAFIDEKLTDLLRFQLAQTIWVRRPILGAFCAICFRCWAAQMDWGAISAGTRELSARRIAISVLCL